MPRKARENTLDGFRLALDAGVDGIELDVHATADGVVVVHHDPHLHPTPDGRHGAGPTDESAGLAIATHSLAALRGAASYELPTLREVLTLVGSQATVYVEVKGDGIEPLVAELLRDVAGARAVHSFDHRVSGRMRALLPTLPTGILSASYLLHPGRALREADARDYWQRWEFIDSALVRDVHEAGGRVVAWTVNASDDIERLAALGVDAICTDVADEVRHVARARVRG